MIPIIKNNFSTVAIACSGGADSMALLDFYRRGKKSIRVLHFNHGTSFGARAQILVEDYCAVYQLPLAVGTLQATAGPGESLEAFWRTQRYTWFRAQTDLPILTAHHLDDCVENWVMTSLHGRPELIPCHNVERNIWRPLLLTRKSQLEAWCANKSVPFLHDESNDNTQFMRNYVRHTMMPHILHVNPGIHKTITKLIKSQLSN